MSKSVKMASIISMSILILFLFYNNSLLTAAAKGVTICFEVIVPSLFPFTAIILFLFNSGIFSRLSSKISNITKLIFGLNGEAFIVFIMSLFGGYPVGAKLINKLVSDGKISENTARRMLNYSVNPGPAFVILGIGNAIYKNTSVGIIIYIANMITSILLCLLFSRKQSIDNKFIESTESANLSIADTFVKSVADASSSIITICGYVILFSSVIGVLTEFIKSNYLNPIVALLEISNGTILLENNIYFVSFLTSFTGFCVHAQVLSMCKNFKIRYSNFLIFRLLNGFLNSLITFTLIKIFKPTIETVTLNSNYIFKPSTHTIVLSFFLILMSVTLLVSVKEKYVEKRV